MPDCAIRLARPNEAAALTELALRAKASWGYSDAFIAACRDELTLTPQKMADWTVWVAEADGALAGMVALSAGDGTGEVEDFFVDQAFQGRGIGSALMATLLAACGELAIGRLFVDADPNAEPIYARLGFSVIGRSPSGSIPGRFLPRMARDVAAS